MTNENNKQPLIRIKNLYKVFGPNEKKVLEQVKSGKSKEDILAKFEQYGYRIQIDSTPMRRRPYLYVEDFMVNNKPIAVVTFNVYKSPNGRKTNIRIINITLKEEYKEQNWRDMRRESRYYKRMIKREFKRIILEK